ncbi:MAG: CDP-glycerol glycerophosphotransferase family protein [Oscillospiraceae bacterium]|nr:CDP-glycerol glycerophosphotransferase family protein [Oscillospiraceae bacterium]
MFIFMSQPDFACNPHALWEYITERTDSKTAWLVRKQEVLFTLRERGIRCELYDTEKGNELLSQANYVICNTIYDFPKHQNQIFVNLWHGSGIKAHGYFYKNLKNSEIRKMKKFCDNTDLLCLHSLDDRFRLSAMLGFDIRKAIVTGQPRLDCVKNSNGKEKLSKIFGEKTANYKKLIFFVPSFRANSSGCSGDFFSDNIFRTADFDNNKLCDFLEVNDAALVYKLHPVEQNAFLGIDNNFNKHCFELTDNMLFSNDVRYDEILNAFDVLITDYSSIAFDWLLLNRPILYLVPDYDKYCKSQGFVFNNIDDYMPGDKVKTFCELLAALESAFNDTQKYHNQIENVIKYRFDYTDGQSAKRVYDTIMDFTPIEQKIEPLQTPMLPTPAYFLKKYFENCLVIDSTKDVYNTETEKLCENSKKIIYITEEIPDENRSVSNRAFSDILDLKLYRYIQTLPNAQILQVNGGVEYEHFKTDYKPCNKKPVIGFAGAIDCRIWFAAVQAVSSAFPDCEIRFAGDIINERPAWLDSLPNLNYIGQVSYDELPKVIADFDVAILPMYGKYRERLPQELFWYLAAGKPVVTAVMPKLPQSEMILQAKSIADFVSQVEVAFTLNHSLY